MFLKCYKFNIKNENKPVDIKQSCKERISVFYMNMDFSVLFKAVLHILMIKIKYRHQILETIDMSILKLFFVYSFFYRKVLDSKKHNPAFVGFTCFGMSFLKVSVCKFEIAQSFAFHLSALWLCITQILRPQLLKNSCTGFHEILWVRICHLIWFWCVPVKQMVVLCNIFTIS